MKSIKYFLSVLAIVMSGIVYAQNSAPVVQKATSKQTSKVVAAKPVKGTHMTFDKESISLGKIKKGDIKKFEYVFTNTGTDIIEIDIASGCDCTTLDYPTKKILPGKKAIINVSFDSGKKEGNEKSTDVDIYLKNLNPKTGQRILKIVNFTYDM